MPQVVVRKKTPKANIYLGRQTVVLRNVIPKVTVYNDLYMPPPVPYIDGGLYNQEAAIADAEFYNTTSWQVVWDGETPY
jgi:hypothetical protein